MVMANIPRLRISAIGHTPYEGGFMRVVRLPKKGVVVVFVTVVVELVEPVLVSIMPLGSSVEVVVNIAESKLTKV